MNLKDISHTNESPKPGDQIRTKKMQMNGVVEKTGTNRAGYEEVFFRLQDGRLMCSPLSNVIVVQKLADEDNEITESRIDELSTEKLTKYKTAAGADATSADKSGDTKRGNKRFKGIINATKKQFSNDAKKDVEEGTMSGINRCAPAQDVSYEHMLDEIMSNDEGQLNELSVDKLNAYKQSAENPSNVQRRPLRKLARTVQGISNASQRIDTKTGNNKPKARATNQQKAPDYMFPNDYAKRLEEFLNLEEDLKTDFADILNKQHQETQATKKQPVKEIPYHGWTIRYRPTSSSTEKVQWQVMDNKGEVKHKGESGTDKDAVRDGQEWINNGGGTKQEASHNVVIDFNVDFAKQFAPGGETFYAAIDKDGNTPMLIFSTEPQKGLKTSHVRTKKSTITANTTKLPAISLSAKESNSLGLQPNGRYVLGDKEQIDDNTYMFPLIFQSISQSKSDKQRLNRPGFIVAHERI